MSDILIDHRGRVVPCRTAALELALSYPGCDFNLPGFAVRNLGWLRLRWGIDTLRITLRAEFFGRAPLETAIMMMAAPNPGTVRYVFERLDQRHPFVEIVPNLHDAVAHLEDLRTHVTSEAARSSFFAERLSLARVRRPKRRVLRALLVEWKGRAGILPDDDPLRPFNNVGSGGRYVVAASDQSWRGRATVRHFGAGISVFGRDWSDQSVGRELEAQPDPIYGKHCSTGYREVAADGTPRLELVDALIIPPDGDPQRCRYDRLLLPWRNSRGELLVSGTSVLRTRHHFPAATSST